MSKLMQSLVLLALLASSVQLACAQSSSSVEQPVTWSLQAPSGETISFPYAHDEPVVLLFWASWCPYCKALMPHLQSILDEYGSDGVTIYAIAFRDDGDPLAYMQDQGYGFVPLANGDEVAKSYGVHGTPGLLIFDADNQLVFNLYDIEVPHRETGASPEKLTHGEKAARKAPYWAAQVRLTLDELIARAAGID